MKRPNLVNKQWSPFQSIPIVSPIQEIIPSYTPEIDVPKIERVIVTKKELMQRNSSFLNFIGLLIIIGISYFLYNVYLERKLFNEYLNYIKDTQEEQYPGFL